MKIKVIGYTNYPEKGLKPEAISAGFARVSRRKEPISFLVEEAQLDLEKSRKSNTMIIHDFGHNSIAEHVVFNVVFEEISRLMSLEIMKHRLNSYIEKSQRYIEIDSGYVVPEEIKNSKFKDEYVNVCNELFNVYGEIIEKLKIVVKEKHPDWKPIDILNGAKEDARFVLPISCFTQFGMTINARNFENLLMRLNTQKLKEGHEAAIILEEQGKNVAPSVIKYTGENKYFSETYENIKKIADFEIEIEDENDADEDRNVKLVDYDKDGDEKLIISLLHSTTNATIEKIKEKVRRLKREQKEKIIRTTLEKLNAHDAVLREFEYLNFVFEFEMSECCYHQFVRHRMNTQTIQNYSDMGFVVPPSIKEAGVEKIFVNVAEKSTKLFNEMKKELLPEAAAYVLTNAHKRRVLAKMNARELYHFSRIREEEYAQWEIRDIAHKMLKLAKEKAPLTFCCSGGRSEYKKKLNKIDNS